MITKYISISESALLCPGTITRILQCKSKYFYIVNRRRILIKYLLHSKLMPYILFIEKKKTFLFASGNSRAINRKIFFDDMCCVQIFLGDV